MKNKVAFLVFVAMVLLFCGCVHTRPVRVYTPPPPPPPPPPVLYSHGQPPPPPPAGKYHHESKKHHAPVTHRDVSRSPRVTEKRPVRDVNRGRSSHVDARVQNHKHATPSRRVPSVQQRPAQKAPAVSSRPSRTAPSVQQRPAQKAPVAPGMNRGKSTPSRTGEKKPAIRKSAKKDKSLKKSKGKESVNPPARPQQPPTGEK